MKKLIVFQSTQKMTDSCDINTYLSTHHTRPTMIAQLSVGGDVSTGHCSLEDTSAVDYYTMLAHLIATVAEHHKMSVKDVFKQVKSQKVLNIKNQIKKKKHVKVTPINKSLRGK